MHLRTARLSQRRFENDQPESTWIFGLLCDLNIIPQPSGCGSEFVELVPDTGFCEVLTISIARKCSMSSPDERRRMASEIVNFEARRDSKGHLTVYKLPVGDGGWAIRSRWDK
jgi:hypothetical protein